jgi:hypothetical protein
MNQFMAIIICRWNLRLEPDGTKCAWRAIAEVKYHWMGDQNFIYSSSTVIQMER